MKMTQTCLALLVACGLLNGCGGYSAGSVAKLDGNAAQGGPGNNGSAPGDTSQNAYNKLVVSGAVSDGQFKGAQVVSLDKVNKELLVSVPLPANPFLDNNPLSVPLTHFKGAHLDLANQLPLPGTSEPPSGTTLTLHIPLASITRNVALADPAKLPNGKAIEGVADGELPAEAVSISGLSKITATIYLGKNVVGVFVDTPFDPLADLKFPILDNANQTWGYIYSYKASTLFGKDGGFFLTVRLPTEISLLIDNNI